MQRYFSNNLSNNKFILNDDDMYHIKKVMRMQNNDLIEVVYNEELYICVLNENDVTIKEKVENSVKKLNITLVIPLLKEQKMDLILQKATELGVDNIIPYKAERSIIKIDSKKEESKISRWQKICKEAAEQSKRLDMPTITKIYTLDEVANLKGINLLCSTKEKEKNIKSLLHSSTIYDKINIVIGPEGGISPKEEEYLNSKSFISVSLGSRILRVETVPIFLMSIINYEFME